MTNFQLSGNILDYFLTFWAGVLVSFTPCLYPLIPITAGIIGGINTHGKKWFGFVISLVYVLGLAMTYCLLGLFASFTGKLFGQILNNPWVYILVANILILFALVFLDVVPFPSWGGAIQQKIRVSNLSTVFFLGMASGLVIGPCTAPILGTLLLYVASKQNLFHGASLLFVFSFGLGSSLILIGTFSSFLSNLPRAGKWLVRIKQFWGLLLLIVAEYFLIKAGGLLIY